MFKIIIVDDNIEFCKLLKNKLQKDMKSQIEISKVFNSGVGIIEYIEENKTDIILLDLNMPQFDGIELLKEFKKLQITTKIIVITGEIEKLWKLLKTNQPIISVFSKPFSLDELIICLRKLIKEEMLESQNSSEILIKILDEFNFNKSSKGYMYIVDCLKFCISNNYKYMPKMSYVYKNIDYNNSIKIKWDIDKSILSMYQITDIDIIKRIFLKDKKPSIKIFLDTILKEYYNSKLP